MSAPHNETNINTDNNFAIVAKPAQIYTEWDGSSGNIIGVEVSITSIQNTMTAIGQDYQNVGAVTLDGIFCPYTTESNHDTLPYWGVSEESGVINQSLNPFFPDNMVSKTGVKTIEEIYYESGTNIAGFNSFSEVGKNAVGDLAPYADMADNGQMGVFARGVGLKSPVIITGWGYDTGGNPVPANSEDETSFASDAFRNPNKWKSGPLDIRWNEDKGMWSFVGGSPIIRFQIVSVDSLNRTAIVQLESRPVDGSVPNTSLEGTITTVHDPNGCFLNEPAANFTGRFGFAVWLAYQSSARWEIFSLCCDAGECVA